MVDGSQVEKTKGRGPKGPGADCENCPLQNRPFVPASGPADARLVVIGEAPGEQEARQGRPFVGPSGRLLDHLLMMNGFRRSDIAFTNTVACHPLKNENPTKEAIEACSGYVDHVIQQRPVKQILAVGKFAAQEMLGRRGKITDLRMGPPKASPRYKGVEVVASIHPAACFRSGDYYPHLVSDVRKLTRPQARWIEPTYEVVDDAETLAQRLADAPTEGSTVFVDAEWAPDKTLLAVGLAWTPDYVLVVGRNALASSDGRGLLGNFLHARRITGFNGRSDVSVLRQLRGDLQLGGDPMLAHYALDERTGIHALDWCAQEHLGTPSWKHVIEQYVGTSKNKDYSLVPLEILYKYNAWDTGTGFQLTTLFEGQLHQQGRYELPYLYTIRVSNMLMEVEAAGLEIDEDNLERLEQEYREKLADLEDEFDRIELNPRSPKQVKEHLRKCSISTESTNEEHLTDICTDLKGEKRREATHAKYRISRSCVGEKRDEALDFVERILKYREYHKMSSTYIDGVRSRLVNSRIYPKYLQHGTVTSRLSSINPNSQNWPRPSTLEGKTIRNLVRARPGYTLIGSDYSQGEFRIVAWLSGAKWALELFNDPNRKIFREFATRFYGPDFDGEQYTRMKNVTYGSFYGGSASHLATITNDLKETVSLQRFLLREVCPEISQWQRDTRHKVVNLGEPLTSVYGRQRHFWNDTLKTKPAIHKVEKECLAFIPQSTLSDMNCEAACELVEQGYDVRILVHDAIYTEVPIDQQEEAEKYIAQVMENVAARRVPGVRIPAEAHSATHWGDIV